MGKKRENIELDKEFVRENLLWGMDGWNKDEDTNDEYRAIDDEITSSDAEDGGADHTLVIQRKSDKKYFQKDYTDWDVEYNFDRDFDGCFKEVFAKETTTIVFK